LITLSFMERIYESVISEHLAELRQMIFLSGPRQVGKTTTARQSARDHEYLTWDRQSDRRRFTRGPDEIASHLGLDTLQDKKTTLVFDELHKYRHWKSFLKGFFDVYGEKAGIIVTGSARLNVFRRGGDSLMGRYFLYRMHPVSLSELVRTKIAKAPVSPPAGISGSDFEQLLVFGGFPEPFLRASARFHNKWKRLRNEQLFREDMRDLTRIQDIGQVEVLAGLISGQTGQLMNFSSLSSDVRAAVGTVMRWFSALENLYFCFSVRPWYRNVPKALRKQPKVYLWDWSLVQDPGARLENFVASHLMKAVQFWTDTGLGEFGLFYLRDKEKREVDFLVVENSRPWFLVEVKSSGKRKLNPNLEYFQQKTGASHAFQLVMDMDYVDRDAFSEKKPVRVPALTLLSQLV